MNLFGRMYDKTMQWSKHKFAVYWLLLVSFIEAIFSYSSGCDVGTNVDVKTAKALRYALYCGLASTIGGMIGYAVGYYAFDFIKDYIALLGLSITLGHRRILV